MGSIARLRRIFRFAGILLTIYLGTIVSSVHADVRATSRYVASSGSDSGDCSSSASPCRTIQYAINQSSSGDVILVAGGTYTYNAAADNCTFLQTRAVGCFVDKRLTILGGYSTSNWSAANPAVNLTIIDGQNTYRGIAAIGYNTTTAYLDMEGFTIQNGRAQGPTYLNPYEPGGMGGGMLVQHAAVTLKDMIFKNNQAIGANTSSGDGGSADGAAIRIESTPAGTSALLQRVVFDNNKSYGGTGPDRGGVAFGALFAYASVVTIEDTTFTNNLAQAGSSSGSGISQRDGWPADALGGAIAIEACSSVTLRRITATSNQIKGGNASSVGGGVHGAAIVVENTPMFVVTDSYLASNIAIAGNAQTGGNASAGGIHAANNGQVTIERTQFLANSVIGGSSTGSGNAGPGAGGGLYLFATQASGAYYATLRNVIVADNFVDQGSGVKSLGNGGGGGIVIHGISADFMHVTIARNRLGSFLVLGQGLVVQPWTLPGVLNLSHSIIADHTEGHSYASAVVAQVGSTLTFNRGLFAGNTRDTNANSIPVAPGTINGLSTMTSASSAGFVSPGAPNYNYRLLGTSPARELAVGSTTTDDIDKLSRPYLIPDLGASEYWPSSPLYKIYLPFVIR